MDDPITLLNLRVEMLERAVFGTDHALELEAAAEAAEPPADAKATGDASP